jgi:hypothetical protein
LDFQSRYPNTQIMVSLFETGSSGSRNGYILVDCATRNTHRTNKLSINLDWDAAAEENQTVIRLSNAYNSQH